VDITNDPSLWEKYQFEIPVLLVNGQEAARHHLSLKKLRVLRQRLEAQPRPGASDSFPPLSASR
jgi:hypothetical protein